MSSFTITAGTTDGYVYGNNAVEGTARATATTFDSGGIAFAVGQTWGLIPGYTMYRGFLAFDLASVPTRDIITSVQLGMVLLWDSSATDFDVQVVQAAWSSPLAAGNQEANYDLALSGTLDAVWRNTSGIATLTQYTGALTVDYPTKGGTTYYALRSSRDKDATSPSGDEYIDIASADHFLSERHPVLIIETRKPAAPCLSSFELDSTGHFGRYIIPWSSDGAGDCVIPLDGRHGAAWAGVPVRLVTVPGAVSPPTVNYDITLTDDAGADLLNGLGLNRSASLIECAPIYSTVDTSTQAGARLYAGVRPVLRIANAGQGKSGTAILYVSREPGHGRYGV